MCSILLSSLVAILYSLVGCIPIGCAVSCFKQKKYYCFGYNLMIALYIAVLLIKFTVEGF